MQINEIIKNYKHFFNIVLGFFGRYIMKKNFGRTTLYDRYFNKLNVENNLILYESSNANSINGNPYALFNFLVDNPDYKDYIHVWSTDDLKNDIIKKYNSHKNVKFVLYNSKQYLKYLATAKFLINDSTFPYYFIKKEDQIYVNIWHGTPLKSMGKDIKSTKIGDHKNVQRNFLHTSYLINSNKFTSDILLKSNDIHTLYNGYIANIGYPRVDQLFKTDKKTLKTMLGVNEDENIVLYAPTWRGESPSSVYNNVNEIICNIEKINQNLPPKYRLFINLHKYTMQFVGLELKKLAIPKHLEINEMLSITDVLITDYSSVFFEFLCTKKPILFFCYDKDEYIKERGLYIPLEELPGPICITPEEVTESLEKIDLIKKKYEKKYDDFIQRFAYNDDGNASKRVADLIFNDHNSFSEDDVYKIKDQRKKILLYPGSLLDDEVTTEFINFVNSFNRVSYDVYVFLDSFSKEEIKSNILKLSNDVKILYKVGTFSFSFNNYLWHVRLLENGVFDKKIEKNIPRELYINETKRLFASSNFDSVLDFRGENKSLIVLLVFGNFKKKYIYSRLLHNRLETQISAKKRVSDKNIKIILSFYKFFNRIYFNFKDPGVVNGNTLNKFSNIKTRLKPLVVPVDYKKILDLSKNNLCIFDNTEYHCDEYDISENKINISGNAFPDKSYVNFIFLGRLVYNEGFSIMINAFAKIQAKKANVRLYIVGDGPLELPLKNKVFKLGLEKKIIFLTRITNPFWILNSCNCVLLPYINMENNYLIESLILQKPIISIGTPNSRAILNEDHGILVGNSVQGFEKGMIKFIENGFVQKYFDFVKYNKNFYDDFFN